MRARSAVGLLCILAVGCGGMADPDVETSSSALKKTAPKKGPSGRDRCAVRAPSDAQQEAIQRELSAGVSQGRAPSGGSIPVHFHVVTGTNAAGTVVGTVQQEWIDDQMVVLNNAFASAGFGFELVSQQVVHNDAWYFAAAGSVEEQDMKASLRRGGANALNIYTTAGDIFLGWATFPSDYKKFGFYDGVVLWWAALPGTGLKIEDVPEEPDGVIEYDLGDTGTHEVGHWLGLYHTFEGGCSPSGDRIHDTPAELEPQFFCAVRDSCTGRQFPGSDPIHNFMDYVDDACMDHFTTDQQDRMQKQWKVYRSKG